MLPASGDLKKQVVDDVQLLSINLSEDQRKNLVSLLGDEILRSEPSSQSPYDLTAADPSELSFARLVDAILRGEHVRSTGSLNTFVDDLEESPEQQMFSGPQSPINVLTSSSWPPIVYAREMTGRFNQFINSSIFVMDEAEIEALLQSVYSSGVQSASRAAVCQLCLIFALGSQVSDEGRSTSTFWFENGRRYLDELLHDSGAPETWLAHAFFMVCLFFITHQRAVAKLYLEFAVKAAKRSQEERPRFHQALVMVDRYLSPMMGEGFAISDRDALGYMEPVIAKQAGELTIRDCISLLSFVGGRLINLVYPTHRTRPFEPQTYICCAHELDAWAAKIPPIYRHIVQPSPDNLPPFSLECYRAQTAYSTLQMVIYRPVLEHLILHVVGALDDNNTTASSPQTIDFFAEQCVKAAWNHLQVSFVYYRQGVVARASVISIYATFQAFLIMVLDNIRRANQHFTSSGSAGPPDLKDPAAAMTIAVTLLEHHAPINDTAKLYAKVCRSMRRRSQPPMTDDWRSTWDSHPSERRGSTSQQARPIMRAHSEHQDSKNTPWTPGPQVSWATHPIPTNTEFNYTSASVDSTPASHYPNPIQYNNRQNLDGINQNLISDTALEWNPIPISLDPTSPMAIDTSLYMDCLPPAPPDSAGYLPQQYCHE